MPIAFHPPQGAIVRVDFDAAFKVPEMVKPRLCVVLSKAMKARPGLLTVVPLSLTPPEPVMPYHVQLRVPFVLPKDWGDAPRWVKGDMVMAMGFHRVDLLRLGKALDGKRVYQTRALPDDLLRQVQRAVLHGLALSELTGHL